MKKIFLLGLIYLPGFLRSQVNDSLTTQDMVYNRPFITLGKTGTNIGGYVEGNSNYFKENGVTEGFSMELRRFNLFVYSSIGPRIRFLSEVEFEHGVEEINLETAMLDFQVNPMLQFRAGILLTPIGAFNQNHDSPRWEIIDRPLVSTRIIPSTLSEVGFGFHGKKGFKGGVFTYDAYALNGLGNGIVLNSVGRTSVPDGKDPEMFGEDNNGTPMYSLKVAAQNFKVGEIGLSYYGGVYNNFRTEGEITDARRRLDIYALDLNTNGKKWYFKGEVCYASIQVPSNLQDLFGEKQWGFFAEGNYVLFTKPVLKWKETKMLVTVRLEKVDFNMGTFATTGEKIYDEISALAAGISLRPNTNTVLRANYRYHLTTDLFGNPPSRMGGFQVGVASYF